MDSLCQAVKLEMIKATTGHPRADWEFISTDPDSCVVRSAEVMVKFICDGRNGQVSSSIVMLSADEEHREELQSHIIAKMFPNISWNAQTHRGTIADRVSTEVKNVSNILQSVKHRNLLPRDLFYFHDGYSCAYTDFVSMDE